MDGAGEECSFHFVFNAAFRDCVKSLSCPSSKTCTLHFPQDPWLQLIQLMCLVWEQSSTDETHSASVSRLAGHYVLKLFGLDLL